MAAAARPRVGVGVFITSPARPGSVLLGKRIGSAGSGSYALPGGHLEFGESWAECAEREVKEETGLAVRKMRVGTVINSVERETNYHYLVVFMVCEAEPGSEPINCEPAKCEGWDWYAWTPTDGLPRPLFRTLKDVLALGFDPFRDAGRLLDDRGALPPYCCVLLHEASSGALLLEERPSSARHAAGQLTCFGGNREEGEGALECIKRECDEELGWVPSSLRRAVDLYVDGELIAWFYEAAAPSSDVELRYEEQRRGVWCYPGDREMEARLSPWHACVISAWRRGESRADFVTPQ